MKETDYPRVSVKYDSNSIIINYDKENEDKWQKSFKWEHIIKVCFKSYDYGAPNFIYLYLEDDPEVYIVPIIDKQGGEALWLEIKTRGLFNPNREIHADTSISQFHCWPDPRE